MPNVDLHIADANNRAPLTGASLSLLRDDGLCVARIESAQADVAVRDEAFVESLLESDPGMRGIGAGVERAVGFVPGRYVVLEQEPPVLDVVAEDVDGGTVTRRQRYQKYRRRVIVVEDAEDVQHFDLLHMPDGEPQIIGEDGRPVDGGVAPFGSKAAAWLRSWRNPRVAWAELKKPFCRTHELSSDEVATVARAMALSLAAALGLYFWLAAPLILVLAFSASVIGEEGFGLPFFGQNVLGYLGGYALDGWSAWGQLCAAYGSNVPAGPAAAAVALGAVAQCAAIVKFFAGRCTPKNPILDELPPPVKEGPNRGTKGTASLVTDRAVVESRLAVCPGDGSELSDTGMYVGFYGRSGYRRLLDACANDAIDGVEAVARRRNPDFSVDDRWRPRAKGEYVFLPGDAHTILFGDTRAGKTRRLLLSTIDLIHRNPKESSIIFDPKGELYGLAGPGLRAAGVEVVVVDLSDPSRSSRWNVATLAIEAWERGEYVKAAQQVSEIVADIAPTTPYEGTSKYFNDGSRGQMRSQLLYAIADKSCPREQKTLTTVSRLCEVYGSALPVEPGNPRNTKTFVPYEEMLEMLPSVDHPAIEAYSAARGANDKERKAFCSTTQTFLSLFRDPAIADMSSTTDNPFVNIATRRQAVFLIVPSNKQAYRPFATMYLKQAYKTLEDIAKEGSGDPGQKISGRLPQRVNIICEELCSIPKWDDLVTATNIGAGYGIRFFLVVQNKALFEGVYEDDAIGILGNCANKVFIRTGDAENTAKWLSGYIGDYTVNVQTTTYSGHRLSPWLSRKSVSTSPDKRPHLTEDEILRWKADYGSIVITGDEPYVVPLPDVSMTPTQRSFDLGSLQHNLEKIYEARYSIAPRPPSTQEKWFPELPKVKDGKRYSDKERRERRARFLQTLAANHVRRTMRSGAASRTAEGGALVAAVFNPSTGEVRTFDRIDEAYVATVTSPSFRGWRHKEAGSLADIEEWLRVEKTKARNRAPTEEDGGRFRSGGGRRKGPSPGKGQLVFDIIEP